jgi:hypothetical protein
MTSFMICTTKYFRGDRMKKNEMGGACRMYGGEERCIQGFGTEICGKETT